MDMNYCRRCGNTLENLENHVYKCSAGHVLFANASPAVEVLLLNDDKEVLIATRALDPGKGRLDVPGGFCDGMETFEDALVRELKEEIGVTPDDYDDLEFLCSFNDLYDYKNEQIPVLTGVFTAHVKPGVTFKPEDDVAEVEFMSYDQIDKSKIQFPSLAAGLEMLHERGTL